MKKKADFSRKLSPEAQAALKKHRDSMAGLHQQTTEHSESKSSRRNVNQRAASIFKRGGQ